MIEDGGKQVVGIAGLFQQGRRSAIRRRWKTRQISATMISGLLLAVRQSRQRFWISTFRLTQRQQTQSA